MHDACLVIGNQFITETAFSSYHLDVRVLIQSDQ